MEFLQVNRKTSTKTEQEYSPERVFNSKKSSSKVLPNFDFQMTELKGLDSKPSARRTPSSSISQTFTTMSINQATSESVSNLESERITNPKSFETMFAVPVSSKFGGLKKRSQVM